jgi:lactate permease
MSLSPSLLAALPILLVVALMLGGQGSLRAGALAWLLALVVATRYFGAGPELIFWSQVRGLALGLWVLYIVWAALLLAEVVRRAGAFESIAAAVSRLSRRRELQLLVLAWIFSAFLQGVTGFGVPVAIVAPLLVGLGFPAVTAVVATSLGHAWAVTFGSVGSSIYALLAVTDLDAAAITPDSAFLAGLAVLACGVAVAWAGGGWTSLRRSWPALIYLSAVMALSQYALARSPAWPLAAFGAATAGLLATPLVARLPRYRPSDPATPLQPALQTMPLRSAILPYALLCLLVILAQLPPLADLLGKLSISLPVPETATRLGWTNAAGQTRPISLLGHTGALIAQAAILSFLIFRRAGRYPAGSARQIVAATWRAARKPGQAILLLVAMAQVMNDSGMTVSLARAIGEAAGPGYPLIAPFIAAVGAFVTGSGTNSNVLFGALQQQAAGHLGLDVPMILAAQNIGGGVGSAFAPAKLVVGLSTVGLIGAESEVTRRVMAWGLGIVALLGLATWILV